MAVPRTPQLAPLCSQVPVLTPAPTFSGIRVRAACQRPGLARSPCSKQSSRFAFHCPGSLVTSCLSSPLPTGARLFLLVGQEFVQTLNSSGDRPLKQVCSYSPQRYKTKHQRNSETHCFVPRKDLEQPSPRPHFCLPTMQPALKCCCTCRYMPHTRDEPCGRSIWIEVEVPGLGIEGHKPQGGLQQP